MEAKRRKFLQQAAAAGAVAVSGAGVAHAGADSTAMAAKHGAKGAHAMHAGGGAMPKGLTLLTMRQDGGYTLGVKTTRGILDVRRAARHHRSGVPVTMDDLIRGGDRGLGELVKLAVARGGKGIFHDEADIEFGPCVTNPEKILCVGLNYARHARETNNPTPTLPILFNKFNNALNSHLGVVKVSAVPAEKFDYESELVIVMGRRASNVSDADALSHVFGYCNGNDFTARDLQQRSSQWMIGKTCDGFGVLGPYIVTADQVDPTNLKIEGKVNGEVRQSSNTSDLVFNCAQIISYASKLMTLEPGDIIYTGTPEGVIAGYPKERQVWLKPGDVLTTTFGNLGTLRFKLA